MPRPFIMILIATWLGVQVAGAQPVSLGLTSIAAKPAEVVFLDLSLSAGGTRPVSLQWQLEYTPSDFESVVVIAGPEATAAQKTVICHDNPNGTKCVFLGLVDGRLNKNPIADGVVAHVRLHMPSNPASAQLSVKLFNAHAASSDGGSLTASGATGTVSVDIAQTAGLNELRCETTWISTPGSSNCTVRLDAPAPAAGLTVFLASEIALLSFPASVTVLAGKTEASFAVQAAASTQRQTGTLTAQAGGGERAIALTVSPPIKLTSMTCEPRAAKPGDSAICAIRLSDAAPPAGATITVLSSDGSLQAPAQIHVRSGQSNLRFRADVSPTATSQTISVTANLGNSTAREDISVSAGIMPILILPPPQTVIHGEPIRLQLVAGDPRGLPVTFSATMLPAGSLLTQDGTFVWTPQLSHKGTNTVRVWATNSAGLSTSREVSIEVVDRKPVITSLVNSASLSTQAPCSPGGLATLFGTGITKNSPKSASADPLPSTLSDVRVKVNGNPAPLLFVSSTQVNFQCPVLASGSLQATVESGLGVSPPFHTSMQQASPGIFTLDALDPGQGSIVVAHRQTVAMIRNASVASEPAIPGDYVAIFATGLGPVSSEIIEGQAGPADPLATVQNYFEVWIGGQPAEVQFAGLAPGFVGTYQVNAKVPANLRTADRAPVTLLLRLSDGTVLESNKVTMAVEAQ